MLGPTFRNIQVSWVKQGLDFARDLLDCGVNDLGGTLMNESISTSAGADHGQLVSPARLRQVARAAGRPPAERDTRYRILRAYSIEPDASEPVSALDEVTDPEARFGSYEQLTREPRFRFDSRRLLPLLDDAQAAPAHAAHEHENDR